MQNVELKPLYIPFIRHTGPRIEYGAGSIRYPDKSNYIKVFWIPAFAGMTGVVTSGSWLLCL
jgi:hypothetical protein